MENLNEACYAYPALKKYPIHTKEAALESYGMYSRQRTMYTDAQRAIIDGNFEKAASYHEITLMEKTASAPVERPKLQFAGRDGEGIDMNEIKTLGQLKKAVEFVLEKRASTPRVLLAEPAKYILWSAANSTEDIASDAMKKIAHIAGIGAGDREKIQHELEKRAVMNIYCDKDKEALWKFANEVKSLSDEEFYREDNLNTICNVMDDIDFMYGNQHKHAADLGYPEDVVFEDTMDDLIKEAGDLYYVPSIDCTMSKKATLERRDGINSFMRRHFDGYEDLDGDALIEKIASLDPYTADALIQAIE